MLIPGAPRFFTAARTSHAVYGRGIVRALVWAGVLTLCGIGLVELKKLGGH
jgi:hypothetical protein